MSVLYLTKHGVVLRISGSRFIVTQGKMKLLEAPALKVDQVVVFGNALITPQAVDYVLKNNINVAYMSTSGRYRGCLQPPISQNLPLRRAQYELAKDSDFCLRLSKAILAAKVRNCVYLFTKRGRGRHRVPEVEQMRQSIRRVERARCLNELLGIEGSSSANYFKLYPRLLKEDFGFGKRIKHPPPDPINILLSLGYSLLFNLVHSMVSLVGLDPYQGFFHQYNFGHAALASDIMEPLRAPVVDALVLRLINLEIIKKEDFRKEGGKFLLRNEALRRYLEQYDQRLLKNRKYAPAKKSLNFKQILEWQCRHLARVLVGKEPWYRPFLWGA